MFYSSVNMILTVNARGCNASIEHVHCLKGRVCIDCTVCHNCCLVLMCVAKYVVSLERSKSRDVSCNGIVETK